MDEEEKRLAEELLFSEEKKPSFAKQLFFGRFDSAQVFPFPHLKEQENSAFIAKVKDFATKEIDPVQIDREAKIPEKIIQRLSELGVLGMTVPKEYGGLGMSYASYCKVSEELARRCNSTALYVNVHQSIGLRALLLFGTEEQKKRWLPPLAKGSETAAFALTEPNAGSDANGIETLAIYDKERKSYRITGKKQWITNGAVAKVITVMAKTAVDTPRGKEQKVTAFLVTPDMPGFFVTEKALDKVGMRGTWTANLKFHDMIVPENNILGSLGKGLKVALTVLDFGRTTFGATCTGGAKELVKRAVDHAVHRYQFKRPLATFQMVKKKIALMSALTYAMDATTYLTAGLIDRKLEDFMLETAILKVFASEALWQIVYDTMQIFGGRSFFTDAPFERVMRDVRLNTIGEGANEVLRVFIGAYGIRDVGIELKTAYDAIWNTFYQLPLLTRTAKSLFNRLIAPTITVKSPKLKKEAKMLSTVIRDFAITTLKLLKTYREDIIEHQLQLNRLTEAVVALYTSTAVLSKLDSPLSNEKDLAIGKFYIHYALKKAKHSLQATKSNEDAKINFLSNQITGLT